MIGQGAQELCESGQGKAFWGGVSGAGGSAFKGGITGGILGKVANLSDPAVKSLYETYDKARD